MPYSLTISSYSFTSFLLSPFFTDRLISRYLSPRASISCVLINSHAFLNTMLSSCMISPDFSAAVINLYGGRTSPFSLISLIRTSAETILFSFVLYIGCRKIVILSSLTAFSILLFRLPYSACNLKSFLSITEYVSFFFNFPSFCSSTSFNSLAASLIISASLTMVKEG